MAIPPSPIELSREEQEELDRQNQLANDPYFHDIIRCGKPLKLRIIRKVVYNKPSNLSRYYCEVHDVLLDMSGYEIGKHPF